MGGLDPKCFTGRRCIGHDHDNQCHRIGYVRFDEEDEKWVIHRRGMPGRGLPLSPEEIIDGVLRVDNADRNFDQVIQLYQGRLAIIGGEEYRISTLTNKNELPFEPLKAGGLNTIYKGPNDIDYIRAAVHAYETIRQEAFRGEVLEMPADEDFFNSCPQTIVDTADFIGSARTPRLLFKVDKKDKAMLSEMIRKHIKPYADERNLGRVHVDHNDEVHSTQCSEYGIPHRDTTEYGLLLGDKKSTGESSRRKNRGNSID